MFKPLGSHGHGLCHLQHQRCSAEPRGDLRLDVAGKEVPRHQQLGAGGVTCHVDLLQKSNMGHMLSVLSHPYFVVVFFGVVDHSDPPNCRLYILGTKNLEPPALSSHIFQALCANSAVSIVAEDLEQNGGQLDLPIHGCLPGRLGLQDHLSLGDDGDLVAGSVWR